MTNLPMNPKEAGGLGIVGILDEMQEVVDQNGEPTLWMVLFRPNQRQAENLVLWDGDERILKFRVENALQNLRELDES